MSPSITLTLQAQTNRIIGTWKAPDGVRQESLVRSVPKDAPLHIGWPSGGGERPACRDREVGFLRFSTTESQSGCTPRPLGCVLGIPGRQGHEGYRPGLREGGTDGHWKGGRSRWRLQQAVIRLRDASISRSKSPWQTLHGARRVAFDSTAQDLLGTKRDVESPCHLWPRDSSVTCNRWHDGWAGPTFHGQTAPSCSFHRIPEEP